MAGREGGGRNNNVFTIRDNYLLSFDFYQFSSGKRSTTHSLEHMYEGRRYVDMDRSKREHEKPIQSMHSLSNPIKDMIWPLDKIEFVAYRVKMRLKLSVTNIDFEIRCD